MKPIHLSTAFCALFFGAWLIPWVVSTRGPLDRGTPRATKHPTPPPLLEAITGALHTPEPQGPAGRARRLAKILEAAGTPAPVVPAPVGHHCPHCLQVTWGQWGSLGNTRVMWNVLLPGESLSWEQGTPHLPSPWAFGVVGVGPHQAQTPLSVIWSPESTAEDVVVPLPAGPGTHILPPPKGWTKGYIRWPSTNPGALVLWGTASTDSQGVASTTPFPTLDLLVFLGLPDAPALSHELSQVVGDLGWSGQALAPLVPPSSAWDGVRSFLRDGLSLLQRDRGAQWALVHPPAPPGGSPPEDTFGLPCGSALCLETTDVLRTWQDLGARRRTWPSHALVVEHKDLMPFWDLLAHPSLPWHRPLLRSRIQKLLGASVAQEAHALFFNKTSGQWLPRDNRVLWLGRDHTRPPPLNGPISIKDFLSMVSGQPGYTPFPVAETLGPQGQQWLTTPKGLVYRSPRALPEVVESFATPPLELRSFVWAFEGQATPPHQWFFWIQPSPQDVGKTLALQLPFLPPDTLCGSLPTQGTPPPGNPGAWSSLPLQGPLGRGHFGFVCSAPTAPGRVPIAIEARLDGQALDPGRIGYGEAAVTQDRPWTWPQAVRYILGPPHGDLPLPSPRLVTLWLGSPAPAPLPPPTQKHLEESAGG